MSNAITAQDIIQWQDDDSIQQLWPHRHHQPTLSQQRYHTGAYLFNNDRMEGIEPSTIFDVDHRDNQYSFTSVMVGNGSQELEHHYYMNRQIMEFHPPQLSAPSTLPSPYAIPPPTPQPYIMQHNYNVNNSGVDMENNDSSWSTRKTLKIRTVPIGMASTVTVNKSLLQKQRQPNDNETTRESYTTNNTQKCETKSQNTTAKEDKMVTVCRQTLRAVMNNIINENYEKALHRLRKTIRILDILIFNKVSKITFPNVKPWFEMFKDIEQQLSSKQHQRQTNNDNHGHGRHGTEKTGDNHNQLLQQENTSTSRVIDNTDITRDDHRTLRKANKNSKINDRTGKSKLNINCQENHRYRKRYRTTGKLVVEEIRHNTFRRCWNNKYWSQKPDQLLLVNPELGFYSICTFL